MKTRDYAFGVWAQAAEVNTPIAKEWFLSQWLTVAVQWFLYSAHWLILLIIFMALGRAFYNARQWRRGAR
jgi:hypothetical protein